MSYHYYFSQDFKIYLFFSSLLWKLSNIKSERYYYIMKPHSLSFNNYHLGLNMFHLYFHSLSFIQGYLKENLKYNTISTMNILFFLYFIFYFFILNHEHFHIYLQRAIFKKTHHTAIIVLKIVLCYHWISQESIFPLLSHKCFVFSPKLFA